MTHSLKTSLRVAALGASALVALTGIARADQVIADDLIVTSSVCAGFDCVNGETFGFDTLRLKENNTRIKFFDTSVGSFPTADWQLTANDSASGGANKFSIEDVDAGRVPFTVTGGAPTNAIFVNSSGRVGFGTSTPVLDLHTSSGNTPGLRLEQDGSSGFATQTWDVAGNEVNFFVRDATNGSTLPLRITPGSPTNSLTIKPDGKIGMGTNLPAEKLHVLGSAAANLTIQMEKTSAPASTWQMVVRQVDGEFAINNPASTGADYIFRRSDSANPGLQLIGNVTATGAFISNGTTLNVPDYVFEDDYALMPLSEVKAFIQANSHLPSVPSAAQVKSEGLDLTTMQLTLLQKVEELTLYTLQQQETIDALQLAIAAK